MTAKSAGSTTPSLAVGPLILRDVLAIDRTRLANERTLLAWLRTAIMLLVSGVTLLKLFEGMFIMEAMGAALIPLSLLTAALGIRRYLRTRDLIEAVELVEPISVNKP